MALTKEHRDQLSDDQFAVPGKRALPIHDAVHVRMAHSMLDKTKGLTEEEKKEAQSRILKKAKELGMDTSEWDVKAAPDADDNIDEQEIDRRNQDQDSETENQEMEREMEHEEMKQTNVQAFTFSALAMEIPDQLEDHPNQTPFKGVLTKLDEPSDYPLGGSDGKRVILPKSVAEKSLASLLGMGIDFTPNLDGHDVKRKIGLITAATIDGNEIHIEGFFYGADFPSEVKRIQNEKAQLGFSYEAQAHIRSLNDDPLVIKDCVFTGAAVLYKDKAAYTTTSLAASKMEKDPMSEEIKKMLEDLQAKFANLEAKMEESKKHVQAGSVHNMVKPHTDAIRAAADGMEKAGIGMHSSSGHVMALKNMADSMDAEAMTGKLPHIYQAPDLYSASAEKTKKDEVNPLMEKIQESIESLNTKLANFEGAKFDASKEPERKTLSPTIMKLLSKAGINPDEDKKLSVADIDKQLEGKNLSIAQRMAIKGDLQLAGKLAN